MTLWLFLVVFIALGFIAYGLYARERRWPLGDRLSSAPASGTLAVPPTSIVFVPVIFGFAWYYHGILAAVAAFAAGAVLALLLTALLRQHLHVFWYAALVGAIAYVIIALRFL